MKHLQSVREKNQQTEFWSIILMSELMCSYYEKFFGEKTLTKKNQVNYLIALYTKQSFKKKDKFNG